MTRPSFVVFWIALTIGLAVAIALFVDASSGDVRTFAAFEPFHIAGHLGLFGVLAYALAGVCRDRTALGVMIFLAVAGVQEWVQALATSRAMSGDSLFDIGVDVIGGAIGVGIYAMRRRRARAAG